MNRTGPEREPDTLCDTPLGVMSAKSLKTLEASTGIEPVYTDLQSAASPLRQLAAVVWYKALRVSRVEAQGAVAYL